MYGNFCGNEEPHGPHDQSSGRCFGIMADDGSNAEEF